MTTTSATRYENDRALLARVLECYKPHCRYLRSMTVTAGGERLSGTGTFEIAESCYIDDTGHLNAVEVNICYNQMLYHVVATAVRHRAGPVFGTWTMEDFWRRRLPDILIARYEASFTRPIDPRRFHGEFSADRLVQRRLRPDTAPLVSLETTFRYWDDNGGAVAGAARIAIVGG